MIQPLRYYEVLVVDNNTPDEQVWRSLETIAREMGPGFATCTWTNGRATSPGR